MTEPQRRPLTDMTQIGLRSTDTQEITVETIYATALSRGLTHAQATLALEALMLAEEEIEEENEQ